VAALRFQRPPPIYANCRNLSIKIYYDCKKTLPCSPPDSFIAQLCNVRCFHRGVPEIAGALTNLLKDPASNLAGARSERLEFGRSKVLLAQPTHRPRHRRNVPMCRRRPHFAEEGALIFLVKRICVSSGRRRQRRAARRSPVAVLSPAHRTPAGWSSQPRAVEAL